MLSLLHVIRVSPLCCNQSRAQHGACRTLAASLPRYSSGSRRRASCSSPLAHTLLGFQPNTQSLAYHMYQVSFLPGFFLVKCTHYCTSQKFMRVCSVLPWHHAWSWKWEGRSWGLSSILPLASSIDASTADVHKRHGVSKTKASRFGGTVTVSLHLGTSTVLMGLGAEHQPGTTHTEHI